MSETEITQPETVSQEQVVITKKDPRRVEQGKRLAMISKQAKERKMREKIERDIQNEPRSWVSYVTTYVSPTVAIVSTSGLLYLWLMSTPKTENVSPPKIENVSPPKTKNVSPPKKFEHLG